MPYNDPFRLRVVKAVTEAIKSIRPDNGCRIDFGDFVDDETGLVRERVFRGRTSFGDNDPLPMVVILEDPRSSDPVSQAQHTQGAAVGKMRLLIQGFIRDDQDHPLDEAYTASAEVVKALVQQKTARDAFGMKGRITFMNIEQPIHRLADNEVATTSYFIVGLSMNLIEKLDDPWF